MPTKQEYQRSNTKPRKPFNTDFDPGEEVVAKTEDWRPTPQVFEHFLVRDYELATRNTYLIMRARKAPITLKEIKECALHSSETLERVLSTQLAAGTVLEAEGQFSLVRE